MPNAMLIYHTDVGKPDSPVVWEYYRRHYLAEGDSWFSMAAFPAGNLLLELQLQHSALVVSCAQPGDTLRHMVDWCRNVPLVNLLARPLFSYKWDALLLSAGGNDLIDAAIASPGLLLRRTSPSADPADYVDAKAFATFERYVRANFEELIGLRDGSGSENRGIPIVIHTYDYLTPRNAPALGFRVLPVGGPWLYRAFTEHGVPEGMWVALANHLIDRLANILLSLGLQNLHVVDTRGTLDRAQPGTTGDSGDWLNEIHANRGGRKKLARVWAKVLDRL